MKRKNKSLTLRAQMLLAVLAMLVPLVAAITFLFVQFGANVRQDWEQEMQRTAGTISRTVDQFVNGVYSSSDTFANDPRLNEVLEQTYGEEEALQKRIDLQYINNRLLTSYNVLQQHARISAIYTRKGELFNLLDPEQQDAGPLAILRGLELFDPRRLSKFYWYPLQTNFFNSVPYGEVRRDRVCIGSRRIYSPTKYDYPYVHLFVVQEKTLYDLYAETVASAKVTVYLLNEQGQLLSSSDETAVATGRLPEALWAGSDAQQMESEAGETLALYRSTSPLNGWQTVVAASAGAMAAQLAQLYRRILSVLLVCVVGCLVLLLWVYRRFMAPIGRMDAAMARVDGGDLQAYVEPAGAGELRHMMEDYNGMLDSLNRNLKARVELEHTKHDLELQVLTSQINPHFLYNTLETIVWKAGEAGRPDIGKLAASLGKLYRLSIQGGQFVPLSQELEHVRAYLEIQRHRCNAPLACDLRVPAELCQHAETLKLVLQPVVENCFLYGFDGVERPLHIRITARRQDGFLWLRVVDNGRGMDAGRLAQVRRQVATGETAVPKSEVYRRRSTGIGLHNISERIRLYYGLSGGVTVSSKQGRGTRVELHIPFRNVPQPPPSA